MRYAYLMQNPKRNVQSIFDAGAKSLDGW